ncbi:hypothetical protein L596_028233 [Steinernema carpocapsae]|uniref:Uncharacterized protein n=1 Tax=Steinernema carpocapsae TaxID=34508 RepID=A0A4U5LXX3_STECR|nr:hypothetical protein L596_028233 [Steinernema carpocapsae]
MRCAGGDRVESEIGVRLKEIPGEEDFFKLHKAEIYEIVPVVVRQDVATMKAPIGRSVVKVWIHTRIAIERVKFVNFRAKKGFCRCADCSSRSEQTKSDRNSLWTANKSTQFIKRRRSGAIFGFLELFRLLCWIQRWEYLKLRALAKSN